MNNKNVQIALFAAFLLIAGGALYYGLSGNSDNSSSSAQGERTAQKVEILKYSDFQCPACRDFVPLEQRLKDEFGDMVEFNYRHFPLSGFQFSRLAAHSAEAAREQGRFYDMHDLIFENQAEWSRGNAWELFEGYAEEIGLDMDQFREDVESDEIAERVEYQRQEGLRRTVNSTPTFFVNGRKLQQNPQSYEQFKSIVELQMYRTN